MEQKYQIGDAVRVVHRLDGDEYYSYNLEGTTGRILNVQPRLGQLGEYIYQLDYITIECPNPKGMPADFWANRAWFNEVCLDPYDEEVHAEDQSFDEVF